jgi:hypothetical protein
MTQGNLGEFHSFNIPGSFLVHSWDSWGIHQELVGECKELEKPLVLGWHWHDAVRMKCSIPNAISKSKSNALLAFDPDPSKCVYSPCTVTVTPHDDGSPKKVHEKLRVWLPPKKGM